jgi:hypothetical protein
MRQWIGSASAAPGETIAPARAMPKCSSSIGWSRNVPGKSARRRSACSSISSLAARGGAAAARKFAVDDDDIEALPCQPLGDQRSGDVAADDQRIAFQVFGYSGSIALLRASNQGELPPRRSACSVLSDSKMVMGAPLGKIDRC